MTEIFEEMVESAAKYGGIGNPIVVALYTLTDPALMGSFYDGAVQHVGEEDKIRTMIYETAAVVEEGLIGVDAILAKSVSGESASYHRNPVANRWKRVIDGVNLLVVDDTAPVARGVYRKICATFQGFNVKVLVDYANDGREANDKFLANPTKYDLIISDNIMPEMNGLDFFKAIHHFIEPARILMSGTFTPETISDAESYGVLHTLEKPSLEGLTDKVKHLLFDPTRKIKR